MRLQRQLEIRHFGCGESLQSGRRTQGKTLPGWRDLLIDAGWNGEAVPGGGARLEAFVELEQGLTLPLGPADRLRRVEAELSSTTFSPWDELTLAEDLRAWPERWRRVFALLSARGTKVATVAPRLAAGAPADSDLGQIQASIRGEATRVGLRGDGSVVLLTGETSWELAHAVAAMLRQDRGGSSVVVRGGDARALDTAFAVQGLAGQGLDSASAWRPACQLLPLALELAYAPRDPYRMLELVTLPLGPFEGWVGLQLARAISKSPGIGGRAWLEAKRAISEASERAWSSPDYNAAEDPYTLTLTLNRERFAFESEKCELAPSKLEEAREPLRKAVAKVCRAVTAAKASAREQSPGTGPSISISLEGHTDTKPFFPREASCGASVAPCSRGEDASCAAIGFENNVRLSGSRAQFLFFKLRGFVHDDAALTSCLDERFTVAGRGPVEPIGSDSQNRRVVFKVRVRAGATAVMGRD
jgi:hypothetical protein